MQMLATGGAEFLGSNLYENSVELNHEVIALDDVRIK